MTKCNFVLQELSLLISVVTLSLIFDLSKFNSSVLGFSIELEYSKTYKNSCRYMKAHYPVHPGSLIRVFPVHMKEALGP